MPRWWLADTWPSRLLAPLGHLFAALAALRRRAYRSGLLRSQRLPVPVIVVGNILVGGTGKTPFVVHLISELKARGRHPGVVCRGYGGRAEQWPVRVTPDSSPGEVGDEPVLLARRCGAPVAAGPNRAAAGRMLIDRAGCDLVVLDDGLQHYRLRRDLEIAVNDAERRLGNGRCLPAGPLREPPRRLKEVDLVLINGIQDESAPGFRLEGRTLLAVDGKGRERSLEDLRGRTVHAVAGIGHPRRFFTQLEAAGVRVLPHPFPDHYAFTPADLSFADERTVVMTEKDAVKCATFAGEDVWYLAVTARMNDAGGAELGRILDTLS